MDRRQFAAISGLALALPGGLSVLKQAARADEPVTDGGQDVLPDKVLLKDYRPKSIFKIPVTEIRKAKFPFFDAHHHAQASTPKELDNQLRLMDAVGMERTIVFPGLRSGATFDNNRKLYSTHPDRFELWCGLDFRGVTEPGFGPAAVKELRRCHQLGAAGLGEISDKGRGFGGRSRAANTPQGPHVDDPRLDPIFETCAELGMPVNIHISDPIWAYEPQNQFNDGLMNAFRWRLDNQPGIMGHNDLIDSLDRAVQRHRKTVFIAAHLINLDYDPTRLGGLLDRNPNLYVDNSARYCETAAIPRAMAEFYRKYADRVVYGTDMNISQQMFSSTFRILESHDEHFYEFRHYHWPQHAFGLPDDVLVKIYRENIIAACKQAKA
jgi:uncharacterized protein